MTFTSSPVEDWQTRASDWTRLVATKRGRFAAGLPKAKPCNRRPEGAAAVKRQLIVHYCCRKLRPKQSQTLWPTWNPHPPPHANVDWRTATGAAQKEEGILQLTAGILL
jgi:hypothetical protein